MNDRRCFALMPRQLKRSLAVLGALIAFVSSLAAGPSTSPAAPPTSPVETTPPITISVAAESVAADAAAADGPIHFESEHLGTFNGKTVRYQAIVDTYHLKADSGEKIGTIVSTTYRRIDLTGDQPRAVLFTFNGGPGSASLWLQMGLVGPKRVDFQDDVHPRTVPPFKITENAESPLDVATVVVIDPPGTGFSTVVRGKETEVFGVEQDAAAIVKFIQDWVAKNGQQNAPQFLLGESYGTIRAARVAKMLAGGPSETGSLTGMTLNGIIMLGQAMDYSGRDSHDDRSYANALPTLAAVAWYHGKVNRKNSTLQTQIDEAASFAAGEFLTILYKGSSATEAEKSRVAKKLAALTGLPEAFVLRKDLRISAKEFSSELLASQGQQIGLYDGRYTLPLVPSGGDVVSDDPAMGQYVPAFVAGVHLHLHDDLKVTTHQPYKAIEFRGINARWDYGHGPGLPQTWNYSNELAVAMRRNPALKLLLGEGTYDLVTTMGDAEYTINHAAIDRNRVIVKRYPSGHMPYLGDENRKLLAKDIREFITAASGAAPRP